MEYIKQMESVFEIIAEPNRRAILSLLVSSEQSVGEIERQLRMPQPTVSKHLRVLREAGFVQSTVDAQRRLYRLKPEPFQEVDAWLAQFRRFWSAHVDALERHLDRMDQGPYGSSKPTKWPLAEVSFLREAQYLRIEAQGLVLVVDVYAGHFDFHFVSP